MRPKENPTNASILYRAFCACLFFSVLVPPLLFSQAPDTLWTKTYGGADWDFAKAIESCDSLSFVIAGYSHSFGNGYELFLIKINSNGDTIWTRTLGGANDDEAFDIHETPSGNLVVAGWTSSFGSGLRDAYLVLTNAQGETIWTNTFGGIARDIAYDVYPAADGGFILAGETRSSGSGLSDLYVVKANAQGDSLWARAFGGAGQDIGYSVLETTDSTIIAVGFTESSGSGLGDVYIVKANASGDSLWAKTYGGTADEHGLKIKPATDGGYIITGYSSSSSSGGDDVYVLKVDDNGDSIWAFLYGGSQDDCGNDIMNTMHGSMIIAGMTRSFGAGNQDVYLLNLTEFGDTIWTQTFGGSSDDAAAAAIQMSDTTILIAGETNSFGAGGYDAWLIRTEAITGIAEQKDNWKLGTKNWEVTASPNPFIDFVGIQLHGKRENRGIGGSEIKIYDISGRLVHKLPIPNCQFPIVSVVWDGRDEERNEVAPGIYFITSGSGNGRITTKLMKLR